MASNTHTQNNDRTMICKIVLQNCAAMNCLHHYTNSTLDYPETSQATRQIVLDCSEPEITQNWFVPIKQGFNEPVLVLTHSALLH